MRNSTGSPIFSDPGSFVSRPLVKGSEDPGYVSRPLVKGSEDPVYEGAASYHCTHICVTSIEYQNNI